MSLTARARDSGQQPSAGGPFDGCRPLSPDVMTYNAEGSLNLYLSPRNQKLSNWLPAQPGPLGAMLQLYAPSAATLSRCGSREERPQRSASRSAHRDPRLTDSGGTSWTW